MCTPDAGTLQPAYLESVYNLISNAIRYSNPEKRPM
jgi:signal transduction histidine kinase